MTELTKSLGDTVAEKIKESIFSRRLFEPGQQLPKEAELAAHFNVSRTALREAIKKLEAENILIIRRGVGTFVSEDFGLGIDTSGLSYEELQRQLLNNWYEARLIWEVPSMALVVKHATREEIEEIEKTQEHIEQLIALNSEEFLQYDILFHKQLTAATHNNIIQRMVENSSAWEWSYYVILQHRRSLHPHMMRNSRESHSNIINFLKERDAEGAAMAMRYHLVSAMRDLKK